MGLDKKSGLKEKKLGIFYFKKKEIVSVKKDKVLVPFKIWKRPVTALRVLPLCGKDQWQPGMFGRSILKSFSSKVIEKYTKEIGWVL